MITLRIPVCFQPLPIICACLLAGCFERTPPEQPLPAPELQVTVDSAAAAELARRHPSVPDTPAVQNVASYLAGLPVSRHSPLSSLTARPAWQTFAADANQSWASYHQTRTTKIREWAASALDSVHQQSPTVFYPFSGPDLLNVVTMFPTSQTYVLVGLEPVGTVPSPHVLEQPQLLPAVKASLWSVLNFSFFRTNDMAVELKSVELDGALPLLLLFAARTQHQVTAVNYLTLAADGQIISTHTSTASAGNAIPGVEVKMQNGNGQEKTAYYFSADLSDWKLSSTNAPLLRYVTSLGPLTTYVKSATYLMHKSYFAKVRNLILARSRYVLQDDSGIAVKYFPRTDWNLTYFGTYRRPINLFARYYQPALTAAYHDSAHQPLHLPFGIGYNWRENDSNLILAKRLPH